jgi:hypothetical protein
LSRTGHFIVLWRVVKKMNKYVVVVLLLVVSVLSGLSKASPTNGDFSNGLVDWTVSGFVSINVYNQALFAENYGDDYDGSRISSLTHQTFDSPGGEQSISFDYQMFSVPDDDDLGEPATDIFTAYLNNVEIFDVNNRDNFPAALEKFSTNVTLLVGDNVLRFELESSDDDYTTTVLLDNVVLTPIVPVPSAMLLGGLGAASVTWLRRRRIL